MSKIQVGIREKWNWLKDKDNAISCVFYLLYAFCFIKMCTNLTYAYGACMYQTFMDYYSYKAMAYFLIVIILLRRVRLWKLPYLVTIATYVGVAVRHFIEMAYEIELKNAMLSKCVAWGLFLLIVVDLICTGRRTKLSRENKIFPYIMLVVFAGALIINFKISLTFICPFLALYLTPISRKQWGKLIDCFTIAYYIAFVWIMTKSLIIVPYSEGTPYGKYYGIFEYNLVPPGTFCAGALICVLYWLVKTTRNGKYFWGKFALCLAAMLYPTVMCAMIGSRTSELGYLTAGIAVFIFCPVKRKKWKGLRRGGIVLLIVLLMLLGGSVLLQLPKTMTLQEASAIVDTHISNTLLNTKVKSWISTIFFTVDGEVSENIRQGTLLAALDRLSSSRMGIFIQCIKDATLWGSGTNVTVTIGDHFYYYPHNNYLTWLCWYGWLGAIPMLIWFLAYVVTSVKRVLQEKYDVYLLPFLWGIFMMVVMFTELIHWTYVVGYVLLMLQYPLLIHMEEGD